MTNLIMTFENKLTMLPTFLKISMNPQLKKKKKNQFMPKQPTTELKRIWLLRIFTYPEKYSNNMHF